MLPPLFSGCLLFIPEHMTHINALIQKIKEGKATAADIALLEALLEQEEDATLRQSLREDFEQVVITGEQVLSPEKTTQVLMQLHQKMEAEQRHPATMRRLPVLKKVLPYAAAVAGLVLLAGLGSMYYRLLRQKGHNNIPLVQHVKFIRNTTGKTVKIILPDDSRVTMEPGTALSFSDNAPRNITLQGKAGFSVKASQDHPFTVNAGNTVTIALGTLFTVDAQAPQMVTIKLETGKVLVRTKEGVEKEDIYLSPGEAFYFDNSTQRYAVAKTSTGHLNTGKTTAIKHAVLMAFSNTPLSKVLNQLQQAFGVTIQYEQSDVEGAYFTGQVLKTDSLQNILEVICQLNNLELTRGEGTMSIRKAR